MTKKEAIETINLKIKELKEDLKLDLKLGLGYRVSIEGNINGLKEAKKIISKIK